MGWVNNQRYKLLRNQVGGDTYVLYPTPIYDIMKAESPDRDGYILFGDFNASTSTYVYVGTGASPPVGNPTISLGLTVPPPPGTILAQTALGASTTKATATPALAVPGVPVITSVLAQSVAPS